MKNRIFISFLAIASIFALNSCEEDLLDITEDFYYEYEISVLTVAPDSIFSAIDTINLAADEELIAKYGDKIKDIEISEVKYWLTFFDGEDDQEIIEASLKVANADGSDETLIAEILNQNLQALLDTSTELPVQKAGLDKMADLILASPHVFRLSYNTTCNKAPLNFKIKFQFKVSLTANPVE